MDTGPNQPSTFGPSPRPATGSYGTIGPQPPHNPAPLAADPGPMPGGTDRSSQQGPPGPSVQSTGPLRAGPYQHDPYGPGRSGAYPSRPSGADPSQGPGQGRPPPRPPQPSKPAPIAGKGSGARAVPLLVAGALAVIVGTAGGWAGTRTLVGQSPLSTSLISPGAESPASAMKTHVDAPKTYGPSALGFTIGVPRDWEEYRLAGDSDAVAVLFVSPDGSRELRIDKIKGSSSKPAQASDFVDTLTAVELGVAAVTVQERTATQVRYRADRVGAQGTSSRVGYAQLTMIGSDLWVVRLTVPADAAGDSSRQLFTSFIQGFHL